MKNKKEFEVRFRHAPDPFRRHGVIRAKKGKGSYSRKKKGEQ